MPNEGKGCWEGGEIAQTTRRAWSPGRLVDLGHERRDDEAIKVGPGRVQVSPAPDDPMTQNMEPDPMMTEAPVAPSTRKPRRQVAKSTARPVEPKVKTAVLLSPEAMRRLGVTALMTGKTHSDLIEELIQTNMRRFVIQDRGRDSDASVESADQEMQEVSAAA